MKKNELLLGNNLTLKKQNKKKYNQPLKKRSPNEVCMQQYHNVTGNVRNDMVNAIWLICDFTKIEHIQKDGK